ncbi:hypothetical protein [Mesorhizobium carmichaelinearum]|uniref:hypothetical protein n=1 Tax=Mesorhizobium carmichaelinearum TaxID=1208188 RepID=UPI0015CC56D4|nr:hypothetical protein [Mesorhizobium carmichaelinearum]
MADQELEAMKAASIRRAIGPTILLGSGTYFDFEAPELSAITIEDVAYGLGFEGRFAGQCYSRILNRRVFYSVAEHCVRMSNVVPEEHAYDALMHELGEATCRDVSGPLKSLCPDFKAVEKRCEAAGFARFAVPMRDPSLIKLFDLRMLVTERRDLLRWNGEPWADRHKIADPLPFEIIPWDPAAADQEGLLERRADTLVKDQIVGGDEGRTAAIEDGCPSGRRFDINPPSAGLGDSKVIGRPRIGAGSNEASMKLYGDLPGELHPVHINPPLPTTRRASLPGRLRRSAPARR